MKWRDGFGRWKPEEFEQQFITQFSQSDDEDSIQLLNKKRAQ